MKRSAPLLALLLCACARSEIVIPTCDNIEAIRKGSKIHMVIHSDSDFITLRSDAGYSDTVYRFYYPCYTINLDPGEVITIEDDNTICELKVGQP